VTLECLERDQAQAQFLIMRRLGDPALVWSVLKQANTAEDLCARLLSGGHIGQAVADAARASTGTEGVFAARVPEPTRKGPHFGYYEILSELGRGGMGVVYEARHPNLDEPVALKTLTKASEAARRLFETEAWVVARLRHNNIITVHDVGQVGGQPYIAMELAAEGSLQQLLDEAGALEIRRAVELCRRIALGLDHAHERCVVHRDIKPGNVLLGPGEEPLIADFGLAEVLDDSLRDESEEGRLVGTLAYMAPEQLDSSIGPVDGRTDLYGLGVTLYELIAGQLPFRAPTDVELIAEILSRSAMPVERSDMPDDVTTLLDRCLAKLPEQRYPSGRALAEDCRRFLAGEPILARPLGRRERLGAWLRRNQRTALLAMAVLSLGFLTSLVSLGFYGLEKARGQRRAQGEAWEAEKATRRAKEARSQAEREARLEEFERAEGELARSALASARKQTELSERRARLQFQRARELVRAFIFEFNDALEVIPGATKARQVLVKNGLRYLREMAEEAGEDRALQLELAQAYGRISEVQWSQSASLGDMAAAEQSSLAGLRVIDREEISDPGDDARIIKAETLLDLASMAQESGRFSAAEQRCRAAIEVLKPSTAKIQNHLTASAYNTLGLAVSKQGRQPEAFRCLDQAEAAVNRALAEQPGRFSSRMLKTTIFVSRGAAAMRAGDIDAAILHNRRAVSLLDEVKNETQSTVLRRAIVANNLGALLAKRKRYGEALEVFAEAAGVLGRLSKLDPNNMSVLRHLITFQTNVGVTSSEFGRFEEANAAFRSALANLPKAKLPLREFVRHLEILVSVIIDNGQRSAAKEDGAASRAAQALAEEALKGGGEWLSRSALWSRLKALQKGRGDR